MNSAHHSVYRWLEEKRKERGKERAGKKEWVKWVDCTGAARKEFKKKTDEIGKKEIDKK